MTDEELAQHAKSLGIDLEGGPGPRAIPTGDDGWPGDAGLPGDFPERFPEDGGDYNMTVGWLVC